MSATPLESVAIVTVTYNSSGPLEPFLASVRKSESSAVTVVVADNDSRDADESRRISESYGATFLEVGANLGYGGAVNAAVRSLGPDKAYVLVSNPDVELREGALRTLTERLDANPGAAAAGPRVLNADGTTYPSARRLPSLRTGVGHALLTGIWPRNPWTRAYRSDESKPDERAVGWLSGSCVLLRRSAFDAVGGFDEGYFMYFEDVDLGFRLGRAGWSNLYVPSAQVVHTGAHSTATESARMLRAHHDSAYRYLQKKYPGPLLAPLRWSLRVGLTVRSRIVTMRVERAQRRSVQAQAPSNPSR